MLEPRARAGNEADVAHGSAHDIAGKGAADPKAMIEAVLRLSKAKQRLGLQPAQA